jgi:hypothetical protein
MEVSIPISNDTNIMPAQTSEVGSTGISNYEGFSQHLILVLKVQLRCVFPNEHRSKRKSVKSKVVPPLS